MPKVAIAGASGFVGTSLQKMFKENGFDVISLRRADIADIYYESGASISPYTFLTIFLPNKPFGRSTINSRISAYSSGRDHFVET